MDYASRGLMSVGLAIAMAVLAVAFRDDQRGRLIFSLASLVATVSAIVVLAIS